MTTPSIFARLLLACGIVSGAWLPATLLAEESRPLPAAPTAPVTRQEVWQTVAAELRGRGLSEEQLPPVENLDLPVAVPAFPGRTLRVSSACWDAGSRRTQFRLECGAPGQCLPFLAYIHGNVHNQDDGNADAVARAVPCRQASRPRPAPQAAPQSAPKPTPKPTVRAGDLATAVLVAAGLRMTASVTCLEPGREGEVIRVRGQDGYVFRARISGPALLEALPQ